MMNAERDLPPLLGQARSFVAMLEHVSQAAPLDRPILVIGERGTGKELIGARLHYLSRRWDRPLVKVNCAALSDDLLDSELFGHEAGAFTGAARRHVGRFERADGGTLFLDEIANASLRVQEKILRAVEYGEFERVGGSTTVTVDVRVIGATNVDLPARVAEGRFRADLLDRLAFDVITLPPLRDRRGDIRLLAEHFGQGMAREIGASGLVQFDDAAIGQMDRYQWPGNVRELKNAVERTIARAPRLDRPLPHVDLDPFQSPYRPVAIDGAPPAPARVSAALPIEPPVQSANGRPSDGQSSDGPFDFTARVRSYEAALLDAALAANRYNRRRTAAYLGLSYDQLRHHLRKHDLGGNGQAPDPRGGIGDHAENVGDR